ncbi:MAG: hypothetical protein ACTSVU_03270 [Promethearchaeota archaeon]
MSLCPHGFPSENCPYCSMATGVKPPIRLVKRAATEIPMPVPKKKELTTPKKLPKVDPFIANSPLNHMPHKLTRNFDLGQSLDGNTLSLFQDRLNIIQASIDPEGILDSKKQPSLLDLRKKYEN